MSSLPLVFALLALAGPPPAGGAAVVAAPEAGTTLPHVVCSGDAARSYALFLPSAYHPSRRWPLVVLMDPRGRALVPLELFRPAADRLGYILISSYDTASDGAWEPNEKALLAMLPDVQQRASVDPRRVHLAGFSGTARAAWDFAARLKEGVAGVIGFGAGFPSPVHPIPGRAAPFFGGAGDEDFNHEEVVAMEAPLRSAAIPHRLAFFPGAHAWPPEPVCSEALEWMELRAMKAGLRDRDDTLTRELLARRLAAARRLEQQGRHREALREHRAIVADFDGVLPVDEPAARAEALAADRGVRKEQARITRLAGEQKRFERLLGSFLARFHAAIPPPTVEQTLSGLGIAGLKATIAGESSDRFAAQAARRRMSLLLVHLSFYEPRSCLERGDAARAAAFLQAADAIRPADPGTHYMLARARAQLGQTRDALASLAVAAASGLLDRARVEADPLLTPLREDPGYRKILDDLDRP
ncbi:MAG TPA: tetratricopeptide repeat protein [Candidatus Polarisedimenticolia bacterium]|nr:tetratricopeptide repeat protein [Candidatus Polarisedimenticolia bacterium]